MEGCCGWEGTAQVYEPDAGDVSDGAMEEGEVGK